MERCPEGIRASCVYQKRAPHNCRATCRRSHPCDHLWLRRSTTSSAERRKTLLMLVNLGCVAMHVMNCRVDEVDKPDGSTFDLDPAEGSLGRPCGAAAPHETRGSWPRAFVKTSGGRGLHIFVPLRRGAAQERVRAYALAIAGEMVREHPKLVTIEARQARRRAPVYSRHHAERAGADDPPPFAVRWRPRAPVSMPLDWDEVSPRLDPVVFNIKTAERRMRAKSPWSSFFGHRQTLLRV